MVVWGDILPYYGSQILKPSFFQKFPETTIRWSVENFLYTLEHFVYHIISLYKKPDDFLKPIGDFLETSL